MINGLAKQTTNAQKAVDYLTGDEYYDKDSLEWKKRDPAPVVLEGDPKSFVQACDSLTFKNKYTSGVLSFSPEETALINANPGLKDEILQDFKNFAFAGIPDDCRNMLAVEHAHTGRLEIHYTIPRVHLGSGKYWNPFEPNYAGKRGKGSDYKFREQNDAYVNYACSKFGLQNPRDLSVARDIKINPFDKNRDSKREIHNAVADLVNSGHITCREDIEKFFVKAGGVITRNSDEYISVKFGDDQKAMRFRGGIYDKSEFSGAAISERELQEARRPTAESIGREFERVMEERTDRVEKRHGEAEKYVDSDKTGDKEFESELSADAGAINEIDKATEEIPDLKSGIDDFISSNSGAVESYQQAIIGSGVEASDVAIAQTDDPVVRFFQQQFKAQAQRLEQQAIAAAKQRWANHQLPPGHDKLLADSVGSIFKAVLGTRTGIDIDRPGRAYTRTQLHQDAAKVSESTQERAVLLEVDRKKMIQDALTSAQQRHHVEQIEQDDQAARQKQDAGYVPSWKRNGHDLDGDDSGPRPRGR